MQKQRYTKHFYINNNFCATCKTCNSIANNMMMIYTSLITYQILNLFFFFGDLKQKIYDEKPHTECTLSHLATAQRARSVICLHRIR